MIRRTTEEHWAWFDAGRLAMADLPYGGGAFVMTVVVPDGQTTAGDLVDELEAATWTEWTSELEESVIDVALLRFELEWEKVLNEILQGGARMTFHQLAPLSGFLAVISTAFTP